MDGQRLSGRRRRLRSVADFALDARLLDARASLRACLSPSIVRRLSPDDVLARDTCPNWTNPRRMSQLETPNRMRQAIAGRTGDHRTGRSNGDRRPVPNIEPAAPRRVRRSKSTCGSCSRTGAAGTRRKRKNYASMEFSRNTGQGGRRGPPTCAGITLGVRAAGRSPL